MNIWPQGRTRFEVGIFTLVILASILRIGTAPPGSWLSIVSQAAVLFGLVLINISYFALFSRSEKEGAPHHKGDDLDQE